MRKLTDLFSVVNIYKCISIPPSILSKALFLFYTICGIALSFSNCKQTKLVARFLLMRQLATIRLSTLQYWKQLFITRQKSIYSPITIIWVWNPRVPSLHIHVHVQCTCMQTCTWSCNIAHYKQQSLHSPCLNVWGKPSGCPACPDGWPTPVEPHWPWSVVLKSLSFLDLVRVIGTVHNIHINILAMTTVMIEIYTYVNSL